MKFIKYFLFISLLLNSMFIEAQLKFPGAQPGYWTPNPNAFVNVQSPNAASLGKYGDVGVSYYTGNPNISIPLYTLDVRGVKMPVSLDYDATGVMPNSLPSWAGQNWTLNIGGVITRTVKGRYDEFKYPKHIESSFIRKPFNYFECHDKIIDYMKEGGKYSKIKESVMYGEYDYSPDEYTFHFMGKSGKFFLDQDGNWRVQSSDNLEVMFDYNNPSNFIGSLFEKYPYSQTVDPEQCKTIAGFVIRDDDGNIYTFGYDKNAIDYTTNFWHMSANEENETWHASSWYLTNVKDKYGNTLYKLSYQRGVYVIQVFNAYYDDFVDEKASGMLGTSMSFDINNSYFPYTVSITSPVYLKGIEAMNGISVDLSSCNVTDNLATEKIYKKLYEVGLQSLYRKLVGMVEKWGISSSGATIGGFYYLQNDKDSLSKFRYPSADPMDVLSRARIRRLQYIVFQWNKPYRGSYLAYRLCTSQSNCRLKLDSLMIQNDAIHYSSQAGIKGVYKFKYNQFEKLPSDYLTSCVDHWGYFNGQPYKFSDSNYAKNLETVRNPNPDYTSIGILNEIVYPTGGVTDFEYESNTYAKVLSNDRQLCSNVSGVGGGLRIKSIKSYDSYKKDILLSEKDYLYNIPNTNISSGELFASPLYYWKEWSLKCESANATYHMTTFHTSSIVPLANSTGVPLGYSYVQEIVRDINNSNQVLESHIYHYSNISNPSVRDQRFLLTFGYADQFTPYDEWSDLGFKKGLLLLEETYDGDGNKIKSIGYKYRHDNYLKDYVLTSNLVYECYGNSSQYYHYLGGIYKLYYPKFDVVEVEDTLFAQKNQVPMVTSHSYSKSDIRLTSWIPYKHQIDLRIMNSETLKRGVFKEKYSYIFGNFDSASGDDSILYKGYMYIKPLKIVYEKNDQFISEEKTEYSRFNVNGKTHLLTKMVTSQNVYNKLDTLINYSAYTSTGMPAIYKEKGNVSTFLRWCWNDSYLMLIGNSYIPFSVSRDQFMDEKSCISYLSSVLKGYNVGQITGYVWNPLFGPVAIIRPNGDVNTYNYDTFGRLISVYDYNNILLKKFCYNYRK